MEHSRKYNSIRNSTFALVEQGIFSVLSFICRTVFIHNLGKTYLGFSGLFSDIFTLLSLAELGIGTAIIYSMYKPMAERNYTIVAGLLNFYKKIYIILGIMIILVGSLLIPFLGFFISDMPEIAELPLIYFLFLLNTAASYFFVYKKSVLITDQKNYISSIIYTVVTILQNILQIIFLISTKNYIIYLIIMLIATILNNVIIAIYVDIHYKELKKYKNVVIDDDNRKKIKQNVKAIFISKISSTIVTSTDNILISKFISTIVLGLYSNYTLFTTILRNVFTKIFEGLTGSVGNLIAKSDDSTVYAVFKKIWFVNFWLVSFCSVMLFIFINPFITLWIGNAYVLNIGIVFMICINFYIRFIRNTFLMLIDSYGLFNEFKVKCVIEAIINLIVSLFLVRIIDMGIIGILLGTIISNVCTNFWYEPYVIYEKKFNISVKEYFITYMKYLLITILTGFFIYILYNYISLEKSWFTFFVNLGISIIIFNATYWVLFHRSEEYSYFKNIITMKLRKN